MKITKIRLLSILLVIAVAMSLLASCAGSTTTTTKPGETTTAATTTGGTSATSGKSPMIKDDGSVRYGKEALDAAVNLADDLLYPLWWQDEMLSKALMEAAVLDDTSKSFIGQVQVGDNPANGLDLKLTDEQYTKLKEGKYTAALSMGWLGDDWATEQIGGIKAELEKMGIEVIAETNADWDDATQISDLESIAAMKPDLLFSIPLNAKTTAGAYRKVADAGTKIVFIDQIAEGFTLGEDCVGTVAADCYMLGMNLADMLVSAIGGEGEVGLMYFNVDFWVTNLRTYGFVARMIAKYPNIKVVVAAGHDNPDLGQEVATTMIARYPDMDGMYSSWSIPAMGAEAAATVAGKTPENFAIVNENFDQIVALNVAQKGMIKGISSQRPRDQATAEARLGGLALLGAEVPIGSLISPVSATFDNLGEAFKTVYHKDLPAEIQAAWDASKK